MKKSELKNIIKEELHKVLKESDPSYETSYDILKNHKEIPRKSIGIYTLYFSKTLHDSNIIAIYKNHTSHLFYTNKPNDKIAERDLKVILDAGKNSFAKSELNPPDLEALVKSIEHGEYL